MGIMRQSAPTLQRRWCFECKCGNLISAVRKETITVMGWVEGPEDEHDTCPTCVERTGA